MAIYFIQCGKNGPIKIGQTSNGIEERIKQLQTGCPYELKLLWVYTGDEYTESQIHERFKHERIRGEWFHPSKSIMDYIFKKLGNTYSVDVANGERITIHEWVLGGNTLYDIKSESFGAELFVRSKKIGVHITSDKLLENLDDNYKVKHCCGNK